MPHTSSMDDAGVKYRMGWSTWLVDHFWVLVGSLCLGSSPDDDTCDPNKCLQRYVEGSYGSFGAEKDHV